MIPKAKLRRLRKKDVVRDWISETQLSYKNIILPYFVIEGEGIKSSIRSMPGVYHFSVDKMLEDIRETEEICAVLLFGISPYKDKNGSYAYKKDNVIQKAIKMIKKKFERLIVITDVCLCGYTSCGHCGIIKRSRVRGQGSRVIDEESTLNVLAKIALSHAEAGADFVAPSSMMDGQVAVIRENLDKHGFRDVGILAYSAKYASNFYSPFRDAVDSYPSFGDRKSYQMDFRNSDEALREIGQDIDEGADIIMVKPALSYLDIIRRAKDNFNIPIAAYNVSGEYAMVKKYCDSNREDEKKIALEILYSIKRAGADLIITYWAKDLAGWLE